MARLEAAELADQAVPEQVEVADGVQDLVAHRFVREPESVVDRPVSAIDFMATVCQALNIDPAGEFWTRSGRPIRVVDKGEKVVKELF